MIRRPPRSPLFPSTPLFRSVRHGRSVRATEAGERLFERGRQLLQDFEGLREWVASDADGGELRLGTVNTALHGFVPAVMRADRKSTRLNSSHLGISDSVFFL